MNNDLSILQKSFIDDSLFIVHSAQQLLNDQPENLDQKNTPEPRDDDNYENDDFASFQLDTKTINLNYSNLLNEITHFLTFRQIP